MSGTEELGAVGGIANTLDRLIRGRREYAGLLRISGRNREAALQDSQANFDELVQKNAWTIATEIIQTDMAPGL